MRYEDEILGEILIRQTELLQPLVKNSEQNFGGI